MFNLIKTVIRNGGYKLADILYKAKKMYLSGDITEEQLDEIVSLASGGANADSERPEALEMLKSLAARVEALEKQIGGKDEPDNEYEEWKPWDGLSNKYQHGAIVKHNGKVWISDFNGQNVWEPGAVGTDALWREYAGG